MRPAFCSLPATVANRPASDAEHHRDEFLRQRKVVLAHVPQHGQRRAESVARKVHVPDRPSRIAEMPTTPSRPIVATSTMSPFSRTVSSEQNALAGKFHS